MDTDQLRDIVEAVLMAANRPLRVQDLEKLFDEHGRPDREELNAALQDLEADCKQRCYQLTRTASGYRLQIRDTYAQWVNRLWEEKPKKYSRATLETLALIAYRQPLTRGDIEQVRGVSVSSEIIRSLQDRGWIRGVGHRDVPGRPALYATTPQFLDDFNLQSLEQLPPLSEIRELAAIDRELALEESQQHGDVSDSGQRAEPELDMTVAVSESDLHLNESEQ